MKKYIGFLILFFALTIPAHAQYLAQWTQGAMPLPAAPANCAPGNGSIYYNTTDNTLYSCTAANTWRPAGFTGNGNTWAQGTIVVSTPVINHTATWNAGAVTFHNMVSNITNTASAAGSHFLEYQIGGANVFDFEIEGDLNITQGTLTASNPTINHTATWNNGAVTFDNIVSNVTNTASNAASQLIDLQVGGASRFYVQVDGTLYAAAMLNTGGSAQIAAAGSFVHNGRNRIHSSADGQTNITNNASNGLSTLTLGPETNAFVRVTPVSVGGVGQGIQILHGDGTTVVFADLAAAANGTMIYCSDCTKATPCAAAGTGALAKRLNGAWDCD